MTYRADIDGLRAVAILLVVLFHFRVFGISQAGFIGVDVFFLISGFLITQIIAQDLSTGRFHFGRFLYRRVRRLYPAMLATFVLYGAVAYWLFLPHRFRELALEAGLSQLYVVNIHFWRSVNYFGLQADDVPLLHMWSLAIEEQFYLLFPLLCLVVHRLWPKGLLPVVAGVAMTSLALGVLASAWKPEAAFYLLPTRGWELLLGGALALAARRWPPGGAWLRLAGPVGMALIGWAIVIHTPVTPVPGWFALLPTMGAAALILSGFDARAPVTRLLSTAPLVGIGLISYPLYLVHWPVLVTLRTLAPDLPLGLRLGGLGASLALAWAIYALIERPVRARIVLARPTGFLATAGGSAAALLVFATVAVRLDGLPGRFSPEVRRLLVYASDQPEGFRSCQHAGHAQALDAMCRLGADGQAASMLVIGDSHAEALAPAIDLWLDEVGRAAVFSFAHACVPVRDAGPARCTSFVGHVLEAAARASDIEEVVLVSSWREPYEGTGFLIDGRWVEHPGTYAAFSEQVTRTVESLVDSGKTVTLIEPLFASPAPVPERLAQNLAFGWDQPVDASLDEHRAEFAELYAAFERAEDAGAQRVSLIDELCVDGRCRSVWQGRPVFTDNSHLATGMGSYMAQVLQEQTAGGSLPR